MLFRSVTGWAATTEIYTLSLHDALPIRCVEAAPLFGDLHIDDENSIGVIFNDAEQPRFQDDRGSNVAASEVFDSLSDLADGKGAQKASRLPRYRTTMTRRLCCTALPCALQK